MLKIHCSHFNFCSGCSINEDVENPPVWKEVLDYFEKNKKQAPLLYMDQTTGWRCRAKLAVRGFVGAPLIGLFKEGSHEVVSIPQCQVHHPKINEAVEVFRSWMVNHHLSPYNEQTGRGEIRYIQLVVERATDLVQLSVVLNRKDGSEVESKRIKELLKQLKTASKDLWHSIWINFNSKATNTIFGLEWLLCEGEPLIWEKFNGTAVCYQPGSFAQANLDLFETMLHRISSLIPDQSKIAEYYAGVGVIGLTLASKSEWVRCIESNPHAEYCFEHSRSRLPEADRKKISFHTGVAKDLVNYLKEASFLIVDPPRKGLDAVLKEAVKKEKSIKKLLYISCGWPAFKKDSEELLTDGWKMSLIEGYLLFPGSNHIELLAYFER